jgi:hypothetical protein
MRMHEPLSPTSPATFQPALQVADKQAAFWLAQVTLRLRREVCWLWRQHGLLAGAADSSGGLLPPMADPLQTTLDLVRFDADKQIFFANDETAQWLTRQLQMSPANEAGDAPPRGGFTWAAAALDLAPAERFVLALALAGVTDSAAGSVFAACQNDATRTRPTLALAQRLWDRPEAIVALADPAHRLYRYGLLETGGSNKSGSDWDAPLLMAPAIGRQLIGRQLAFPESMPLAATPLDAPDPTLALVAARLRAVPADRVRIQPLCGVAQSPMPQTASRLARLLGSRLVQPPHGLRSDDLPAWLTLAWLRGESPGIDFNLLLHDMHHDSPADIPLPGLPWGLPWGLPLTIFVFLGERSQAKRLPAAVTQPILNLPELDYAGRLHCWRQGLSGALGNAGMQDAIADCARRFRFEAAAIERICTTLNALGRPPCPSDLPAACRGDADLGDLAQAVDSRFELSDLMLPAKQAGQIAELVQAAAHLTRVHHDWGTARAWNESGLSALFAGPPGTGKTMAAEAIARAVGMPMYRIDLSQVVNKYVGETEKNLRRLFDVAEGIDAILFFDEADSLFGKRSEVKDAHDRYANLEISYLLERMERFKGMAILASNRKKDLDEAFLRRLRYVIDFPLPGPEERLAIWRGMMPPGVAVTEVDFVFLARQFALAGGHIRSIVFQACLQGAARNDGRRLDMPLLLRAVRRELDKLGRPVSPDQFGPWASHIEDAS